MLVLWVPVTSLCLVERSGFLAADDCCPTASQETLPTPEQDIFPCCSLAFGNYRTNHDRPVIIDTAVSLPSSAILLEELWDAPEMRLHSSSSDAPPIQLAVSWQFSCRAALSPRAPSSAS